MSDRFRYIKVAFCIVLVVVTFLSSVTVAYGTTVTTGYVNATNVNVRADATTKSESLGKVSYVTLPVTGSKQGEGGLWYQVTYNGMTGYIRYDLIQVTTHSTDESFESTLSAFPESYHDGLRTLHAAYPNWKFTADNITISLDEAVELESVKRRKEVSQSQSVSWRSMGPNAYDWDTEEWIVDNGGWVSASRELIAYYMDPRNFLNSTYAIQYMQHSYDATTQTADGVKKIVSGSFLENGYNDLNDTEYGGSYINVIMAAAAQSNVSPYIIASTIIQEQGRDGTSELISGSSGVYNFFNVKASGSTHQQVIENGLNYARGQGWKTRSASIIGGAQFYAKSYINVGQDTYFYKNYNIINLANISHQYAQNVSDAANSASIASGIYSSEKSMSLTLRIPVYKSMPSVASAKPAKSDNKNNYYFKSISVAGLTPTFSMYSYEYDLNISGNTTINVTCPVNASLVSNKTFQLSQGENSVTLRVKAESGYTTDYIINVNASVSATLTVSDGASQGPSETTVVRGDTNSDGKISLIDLANVQKHILGIKFLTGDNFTGADTNRDGKISLIDLANIQKHLLGVKILEQ